MLAMNTVEAKRTSVLGLGLTGLSVVRFLCRQGLPVNVMDSRETPPGLDSLNREFPEVNCITGAFSAESLADCEQLIVSPGIALREPLIQQAQAAGIEVIGDIELFARHAKAPVVAITGANGKSTVTTLLAEMIEASGFEVRAGANLGTPALDLIGDTEPDFYVLELSSFQLDTTASLNPAASVVLNISPDHMDRYADLAAYAASKQGIYAGSGTMVINRDDPLVAAMQMPGRAMLSFGLKPDPRGYCIGQRDGQIWLAEGRRALMSVGEMAMQGRHNQANALAALALGRSIGLDEARMLEVLRHFNGLPHRCQRVAEVNGVSWYNDSKGTNVGASCAAIEGLAGLGPIILIAGGVGKGAEFAALGEALPGRVRQVLLYGQDAGAIAAAIPAGVPCQTVADLAEAVRRASQQAQSGDLVLFSPACASFDMFDSYVHRGEVFCRLVAEVTGT